jgi:micrococcal nuclease
VRVGRRRLAVLLLATCFVLAGCAASTAEERTARVVDVVDGDTVDVRFPDGSQDTIRILGIDAPETRGAVHPDEFGVPDTESGRGCLREIGESATDAMAPLEGRRVTILTDPLADRRGSYGRLLAYVETNGTDRGKRLLRRGLARVYESEFTRRGAYDDAAGAARRNATGVWGCGAE